MRCCLLLLTAESLNCHCVQYLLLCQEEQARGEICSRVVGRRRSRSERECLFSGAEDYVCFSPPSCIHILLLQGRSTVSIARALCDSLFRHVCVHLFVSLSFCPFSVSLSLSLVSLSSVLCVFLFLCSSFSHKLHGLSTSASFHSPASFLCFLVVFVPLLQGPECDFDLLHLPTLLLLDRFSLLVPQFMFLGKAIE